MRLAKYVTAVALAATLFAAGCDDDGKPGVTPTPSAPDGGAADAGGPEVGESDAGATDTGTPLVPITEWIHDLVTAFGPMSAPDTVDDKRLIDTEDPGAFDSLLQ